ncbi:hypothetical protein MRX96_035993 [Rhipicephalus microplus]
MDGANPRQPNLVSLLSALHPVNPSPTQFPHAMHGTASKSTEEAADGEHPGIITLTGGVWKRPAAPRYDTRKAHTRDKKEEPRSTREEREKAAKATAADRARPSDGRRHSCRPHRGQRYPIVGRPGWTIWSTRAEIGCATERGAGQTST